MTDDPLMITWSLVKNARTRAARYIDSILNIQGDVLHNDRLETENRIRHANGTKFITYREDINPQLETHDIYKPSKPLSNIKEYHRIAFSRIRLSSHKLAIETGRWSRIPRERRLCICGEIETEEHVLCFYPQTTRYRTELQQLEYRLPQLFQTEHLNDLCRLCFLCLNK